VDSVINKNQEAQLGRSVLAQLRSAGAILEDPQLKEFIQDLGSKLVGLANDGTQSFEFFVGYQRVCGARWLYWRQFRPDPGKRERE
jgi:predicted Zn-dependent protease